MNWVFFKAGYPKLFVPFKQRQGYYKAIDHHNKKDAKGYCDGMFKLFVEQFKL